MTLHIGATAVPLLAYAVYASLSSKNPDTFETVQWDSPREALAT